MVFGELLHGAFGAGRQGPAGDPVDLLLGEVDLQGGEAVDQVSPQVPAVGVRAQQVQPCLPLAYGPWCHLSYFLLEKSFERGLL